MAAHLSFMKVIRAVGAGDRDRHLRLRQRVHEPALRDPAARQSSRRRSGSASPSACRSRSPSCSSASCSRIPQRGAARRCSSAAWSGSASRSRAMRRTAASWKRAWPQRQRAGRIERRCRSCVRPRDVAAPEPVAAGARLERLERTSRISRRWRSRKGTSTSARSFLIDWARKQGILDERITAVFAEVKGGAEPAALEALGARCSCAWRWRTA